jgi:hypothetical protein
MSHHPGQLYQWQAELVRHFGSLSLPQVKGLAQWSFGMMLAGSGSLAAVATQLAALLEEPLETSKKRLREWYCPKGKKKSRRRRELEVHPCQRELLAWLLEGWPDQRLAVALDATNLSDRLVVLAASVLYQGFAIPVAWRIVKANCKGAWKPHWQEIIDELAPKMPEHLEVFVLADRGLYAPWLFQQIIGLGWHPFLRINPHGWFRVNGQEAFVPLQQLAAREGESCHYPGTAFKGKTKQLKECRLLSTWQPGQETAWLILTDAKTSNDIGTYALRNWIEQGFKHTKRDGWQWHKSRITDPTRAERIWLAMAVSTLWLAKVGGQAEAASAAARDRRASAAKVVRAVSLFRRGMAELRAKIVCGRRLPTGRWYYRPWPTFHAHTQASRPPPAL